MLKEKLIAINEAKRPGKKIKPEYITVHTTGIALEDEYAKIKNTSNAQRYSWHIGIGEDDAFVAIPLDEFAYHAQAGNDSSIGVMVSTHIKSYEDEEDRLRQVAAVVSKAETIVAEYMAGFGFTSSRLKGHSDWNEDKSCPNFITKKLSGFKTSVAGQISNFKVMPNLKSASVGDEISIAYDQTRALLSSGCVTAKANEEIKLIMIQATTKGDAYTAFATIESDDEQNAIQAKAAHFVLDADNVVKFCPSSTCVFDKTTQFSITADNIVNVKENFFKPTLSQTIFGLKPAFEPNVKIPLDTKDPGNSILVVDLCIDGANDANSVEKNLIRFLCYYLKTHQLETANIYRAYDLIENFPTPERYKDVRDWEKLLDEVQKCLDNPSRDPQNIALSIDPEWTKDNRKISQIKKAVKVNAVSMTEEDFESITIGSDVFTQSKFEKQEQSHEFIQMQQNLYEPPYPDLTVPPRSATSLYNVGIKDSREIVDLIDQKEKYDEESTFANDTQIEGVETEDLVQGEVQELPLGTNIKQKPVLGKIPNIFDPYPVDDKVAQLEMHAPMVTLEYEDASAISSNLPYYMINRFINAEKRLVQLENICAANIRMLHRMGARVNINCVYYGGQSVFSKYKCIRCLSDDLTNDAACVTLEQCLNCSRYEPIEGQVYEFMNRDAGPGKANIFDDIQASYMSRDDYVELTRIEEENREDNRPLVDLTQLNTRLESDKDYEELLAKANNFVMNWSKTPLEKQSPHINKYDYDFARIGLDKTRYNQEEKYEDGWKDVEQNKYQRPDYGRATLGGGGFGGSVYGNASTGVYFNLEDYELEKEDMRYKILDFAKRACELGNNKGFQYTLGAKIQLRSETPEQLVQRALKGEEVSTFTLGRGANDTDKAVYTDCSNFANYIYYIASNGLVDIPGTTESLENHGDFTIIGKGLPVLDALKEAIPGDLILYRKPIDNSGHVAIYAGSDKCYEAYGDVAETEKQVLENQVKDRSDFVGIYRHKTLSVPKLKGIRYVPVKISSAEFVRQYQMNEAKNTSDGQDHTYTTDFTTIHKYVNVLDKLSTEDRLQFMDITTVFPEEIVNAEVIAKFLKAVAPNVDRSNTMPNPQAFIEAQRQSGINALFLAAHCAGETGWGTSNWMNGGGRYKDPNNGKCLYNAYGLWCYNSDSARSTAIQRASEHGWYSKEEAVIGGAKYVAQQYLSDEQVAKHGMRNTPYFMKWHMGTTIEGNAGSPGTMQYASDISWAAQRGKMIYRMLKNCTGGPEQAMSYAKLIIPQYKDPASR